MAAADAADSLPAAAEPVAPSIGILSLGATLVLNDVDIRVAKGGIGGNGGDGQPGGNGGNFGGQGGTGACPGGIGGNGGRGGSGGGGVGGHSVGIALNGGMVTQSQVTIHHEDGSPGGAGGDMDASVNGDPGKACSTLDFPSLNCVP